MATLQNIRSKGPLLVIVVGLALFAFIAGDVFKAIQPHQTQDVGEINGDAVSAQEYQDLVEEYTEVIKLTQGDNVISDEVSNQIKDVVWRNYVNNKLIEAEAEKIGLTVSDAEIQAIINAGVHPLLSQTPFINQQTGAFDQDMLKKFLVDYAQMQVGQYPAEYMESYSRLYTLWSFIEKTLKESRLQDKYMALVSNAIISNPVETQAAFDARTNQTNMLMAAIPYNAIADSLITVNATELKDLYNKRKEEFKQFAETRDVKYIDVQVVASEEDKAALQAEMNEYAAQLAEATDNYSTFIRSTSSDVPYVDLFSTQRSLPLDVIARLDSVALGGVFGPYYNATDNTMNAFKKLAVAKMADSIEFRQIQVVEADAERTKFVADSLFNAIKAGADFAEVAKTYGQTGEPVWISSANYEGAQIDGDNLKYIEAITTGKVKELVNLPLMQANIILQVTNKKADVEKYKVAVVKRSVDFSKETYNKAYNEFSQFISENQTLAELEANAEDAGYRLLERADLSSSEHTIGSVRGTKDALRWAFEANVGEVSGLYECGDNDRMLVVAVSGITPEGYRSLDQVKMELSLELAREKKAEKILADLKAANVTSFEQFAALEDAVSDSLKYVTFGAPAYVTSLRSSEPQVSAYVNEEMNKVSAPVKGLAGVYVLQPYGVEKQEQAYDAEAEERTIVNQYARSVMQQLVNDLYIKGNVADQRYIFF
ncbi:MAG: SurA N-terminal domain-containing protein [Bacteroides sp.]|nr:SurA N-terminal domain-containing protein [Bacteroides sp.]